LAGLEAVVKKEVGTMEKRMDIMENRIGAMEDRMSTMENGMQDIKDKMGHLGMTRWICFSKSRIFLHYCTWY